MLFSMQNVTWEGDNNVLLLQTARYLLKALVTAAQGKPVLGSAAYLSQLSTELNTKCAAKCEACWGDIQTALAALAHRATRLATVAADVLRRANGGKVREAAVVFVSDVCSSFLYALVDCRLYIHIPCTDTSRRCPACCSNCRGYFLFFPVAVTA